MRRRLGGASEEYLLVMQGNLANTYRHLGREEEALSMRRDVYSGWLRLVGEEHGDTIREAKNYAISLFNLQRFEEAKALLRKTVPVGRRVLGESDELTLKMRWNYAVALYKDDGATLDDLHEAVTALEETERVAKRVLGGAHPDLVGIRNSLQASRKALSARETPSGSA